MSKIPRTAMQWGTATVWVLAAAAAIVLGVRTYLSLQQPLGVFPSYYTAATLIREGQDIANFYDDAWFNQRVREITPNVSEIHNANPPMMGFFFLPFVGLPYDAARALMSVLGFVAVALAVHLMTVELGIRGIWRAAGFFGAFGSPHVLANLSQAQVYPIILFMFVLAWLAWRRRAEMTGGALIGLCLACKTAGSFLLPLMVLERRWRALAGAVGVIAFLVVVTFPFVRLEGWMAYFAYAAELIGQPRLGIAYFQSLAGFARNLFVYDARWNPDPYMNAPALAHGLEAVLFVSLFLTSARIVVLTKDRDITFSLFVMLSLILVPVANGAMMVLAYLPVFVIFSRLHDRMTTPLGGLFLAGAILAFAPGLDRFRALADWAGPIVFYPRLFGQVVLLGLLMALGTRSRRMSLVDPAFLTTADDPAQSSRHQSAGFP